ncbi:MAG: arylamine N-acetyltransferase [Deltaproteobacteria bacterium]|nr:arylamine N-acetyltransferase [Deltaproteobacteria bacterium]MBI2974537.1 arylamine N-acetyltransferase [Deltaproteobacteria bacterium]
MLNRLVQLTQSFLKYPYENLTKIIHAKNAKTEAEYLRMPEIVLDEHKRFGAGGTCFSLTYFFESILKDAGFDCYPVMVDRSYGKNTHCALIITIDRQKYLVDPGYCLSRPIPLTEKEAVHHLPHNTYIVQPVPPPSASLPQGEGKIQRAYYNIATSQLGQIKPRYLLKDTPVPPEQFLQFWKDSFSWPMMKHLLITRLSENGYLYLRDDFVRHTTSDSKKQEHIRQNYDKRITELFGLSPKIVKEASEIINGL